MTVRLFTHRLYSILFVTKTLTTIISKNSLSVISWIGAYEDGKFGNGGDL